MPQFPTKFHKSFFQINFHIIMPTNGPQLWPVNVVNPINPPVMQRSIDRPKKNRNKVNDEPRIRNTLPRTLQTVKCKKCESFGHNKQTCKGKRAAERAIPKGGNKKPLKKGVTSRARKRDKLL
ncbi:unnamed protein product [Lathyrus sativus]|nr:unnamed protein product [Lathyrus sativus]